MNAEIFCIGTEVLIGDIVNTNAAYIAKKLSEAGINVYYHSVCGDNVERIEKCLDTAFSRSDLVITTGGLGPTYDDITKEIIAKKLGLELEENSDIIRRLEEHFKKSGRTMTDNNRKQAMIPKGAYIFENRYGTADGIAVESGGKKVIMLPGPPREVQPMLDEQVIPYLSGEAEYVLVSSNVNIFGMGESTVETTLGDLMQTSENPTVAPYVNAGEVRLRVTARGKDQGEARALIAPVVEKIKSLIGDAVYGVDEKSIESVLVRKLSEKKKKIAFAESCTGGLISKRLTDVPGASEVFGYGFTTYANEAKEALLGVKRETLEMHGAVSSETAEEMALGALKASGADIAISVTGIAGPGGGTAEKPVGLVYMGIASSSGCHTKKLLLAQYSSSPDRDFIRTLTATNAFKAAIEELEKL